MRRKEAIEAIKNNWHDSSFTMLREALETLIPELRESEDERIRKAIIEHFEGSHSSTYPYKGFTKKQILAWLEKQGEQVLTDKVEPKFKQGDWVVYENRVGLIIKIIQEHYIISFNGVEEQVSFIFNDRITKWTIQYAKDGDVLYNAEHNYILVYKHQTGTNDFVSYCRLCLNTYTFYPCEEFEWDDLIWNPSTKEQREQLEKAMAEDGYEWDADKKKLSKCIIDESKSEIDYCFTKMMNCEKVSPPTWSEEDEKTWKELIEEVKDQLVSVPAPDCRDKEDEKALKQLTRWLDWLESLKERVQPQQKQEWSEDDERIYKSITYAFAHNYPLTVQQREFVKSLKNRVGCETNCTTTNAWDEF